MRMMFGIKKEKLFSIITALILLISATALIFNISSARAEQKFKIPAYVGYVNDFADIISYQNKDSLNYYLSELDKQTGAQIAVVTISSLKGNSVEDVALNFGRTWGVGQKGKNNGIIILVAPNDRKMRIEVGYGLEPIITDGKSGRIRDDYMIPYFKQGDYEKGIINGTIAITSEIARAYKVEMPTEFNSYSSSLPQSQGYSQKRAGSNLDFIIFIVFLILFIISPRNMLWFLLGLLGGSNNYGSGFGGRSSGGSFGGGSFGGGGSSGSW